MPQYEQFLRNHYLNRGMLQERLGRLSAARASYAEALKLREALAGTRPELAAFRPSLAELTHHVGMLDFHAGNPAEALQHFGRAREMYQELQRSHPDDLGLLSSLGGIQNDYGMALAALGRHPEAVDALRTAIGHQRRALKRAPESRQFRHFLANHLWNLARSMRALGRPAEAAAAARECLEFHSGNPVGLYNTACELSLCVPLTGGDDAKARAARDRYAAWAIDGLKRAIAAGFRDVSHIQADRDLDPLRSRQDFQLLMMDLAFPVDPFRVGLARLR
jgi:tetratricopeptide (TPR) repeat protein